MVSVAQGDRPYPLVRRMVLLLSLPTVLLVAGHVAVGGYHRFASPSPDAVRLVDLGGAASVPAFWNAVLLLFDAGVALVLAVLSGRGRALSARSWSVVALAFTWLAVDERFELHERMKGLGLAVGDAVGVEVPTYAWVVPGSVLALAGLAVFAWWCRALPVDVRRWFVAAAGVYVGGALVLEAVNGYLAHRWGPNLLHLPDTTVEECLEMTGCILAAAAMLRLVRVEHAPRRAALRDAVPAVAAEPA